MTRCQCYQVVSDDEIKILYMETKRVEPHFPYEDYPNEFPEMPVSLTPISYEDHMHLDIEREVL